MCRHCFEIYNLADLRGPWEGWRLRGRDLVSPDRERIPVQRLVGILWREKMAAQIQTTEKRVCQAGGADLAQGFADLVLELRSESSR